MSNLRESAQDGLHVATEEAEQLFLSACFNSEEASQCAEYLGRIQDRWIVPAHRFIFQSIQAICEAGNKPDFEAVKSALTRHGQLAEAGGKEYLDELVFKGALPPMFPRYIRDLDDCHNRLETRRIGQKLVAYSGDLSIQLPDTLAEVESDIYEIAINDRKLEQGRSIVDFAELPIPQEDTLLGNRFLCCEGGLVVVAPSGQGKSSVSIQMAILWSCGRGAFGIKPACPLRILIIQSEDDDGDCAEMARMVDHLELTVEERRLVSKNTEVVHESERTGADFAQMLRRRLAKRVFDIVIVNPLTAYAGCDISDPEKINRFLRGEITPILRRFRCGLIFIHHTPKTNFQNTDKYELTDWMYWGAGRADITNWARAYIVIKPIGGGIFRFIAAKRGTRIGWEGLFEKHFCHCKEPGVIRWDEPGATEIANAKTNASKRKVVDCEAVLKMLPVLEPKPKRVLEREIGASLNLGQDKVKDILQLLAEQGRIKESTVPNPTGKRAFAGWIRVQDEPKDKEQGEDVR